MDRPAYEPGTVFQPRVLESNPSYDPSVASSAVSSSFKRSGSRFMTEAAEGEILSQATAQAMSAARSIIMSGGTQSTALSTAKAAAKSVLMPKRRPGGAKPPLAPQQKGFFGRKKGKQQAEIIASMALVTVNSSMSQQGLIGQNQSTYDPTGMMLPRSGNSVLSGISMEEDSLIRRLRTPYQDPLSPTNSTATFSKLMNESSVDGADHTRSPSRASVRAPTPTMNQARPLPRASVRSSTPEISPPSPNRREKEPAPGIGAEAPVHDQKLESVPAPVATNDTTPSPPLAKASSPPKLPPASPTLSTIFRKKGRMSKKKKEAIVAAVVESTMNGQEESDGKGNYFRQKEARLEKQAPPTELPKITRIPSEMPLPRSQPKKSISLKADAKSKKSKASKKKSGNSKTMTDVEQNSISYSSSFSGTDDESHSALSYSIDAYETHSHEDHETSDDETLSTNGGETKDLSVQDKASPWIEPFFASITAAFTCSPIKTSEEVEHGDGDTTDEEEVGNNNEAAFFPESRDDEENRQVHETCLSTDSSMQLTDGEAAEERETSTAVEEKQDTKKEKPVSMEQLVLRALAATISPSSNRPKLDLNKAPPPKPKSMLRNLPTRPTSRGPSTLHSTHAMVRAMSKNSQTGLYSPPSCDPPLQFSNEQMSELAEDASNSKSFPIGSGETEDVADNGKKSAMIPGWLRRKGGKTRGSF